MREDEENSTCLRPCETTWRHARRRAGGSEREQDQALDWAGAGPAAARAGRHHGAERQYPRRHRRPPDRRPRGDERHRPRPPHLGAGNTMRRGPHPPARALMPARHAGCQRRPEHCSPPRAPMRPGRPERRPGRIGALSPCARWSPSSSSPRYRSREPLARNIRMPI